MLLQFEIQSNNPVDVYVVPSEADFKLLQDGKEFRYYPLLSRQSILHYQAEGVVLATSYIIIFNSGDSDAIVSLKAIAVESREKSYETDKTTLTFILTSAQTATPTQEAFYLKTQTWYYEPYPLAFYNAFYHQKSPDVTFEIYNPMDYPITVRLTSEYQGISYPAITTETIIPGERKTINQTIQLKADEVEKIKTKTKITLHYKIEYEEGGQWRVWDEQTVMIDAYPKDTMVLWMKDNEGNWHPMHEYIAVFVTPKVEEVRELLAIAKEYAIDDFGPYSDYGLYRSLPGYQCEDCTDEKWVIYTALQVKAIYNALKYEYGISYVHMPTAFATDKENTQRISTPKESLYLSSANCVDGAILFASVLEALGMHPYIVIVPGHAFVAWDVKGDGTIIDALETTMIGSHDFEDAWVKGNKELEKYWDVLWDDDYRNGVIIDITACREAGILPME